MGLLIDLCVGRSVYKLMFLFETNVKRTKIKLLVIIFELIVFNV